MKIQHKAGKRIFSLLFVLILVALQVNATFYSYADPQHYGFSGHISSYTSTTIPPLGHSKHPVGDTATPAAKASTSSQKERISDTFITVYTEQELRQVLGSSSPPSTIFLGDNITLGFSTIPIHITKGDLVVRGLPSLAAKPTITYLNTGFELATLGLSTITISNINLRSHGSTPLVTVKVPQRAPVILLEQVTFRGNYLADNPNGTIVFQGENVLYTTNTAIRARHIRIGGIFRAQGTSDSALFHTTSSHSTITVLPFAVLQAKQYTHFSDTTEGLALLQHGTGSCLVLDLFDTLITPTQMLATWEIAEQATVTIDCINPSSNSIIIEKFQALPQSQLSLFTSSTQPLLQFAGAKPTFTATQPHTLILGAPHSEVFANMEDAQMTIAANSGNISRASFTLPLEKSFSMWEHTTTEITGTVTTSPLWNQATLLALGERPLQAEQTEPGHITGYTTPYAQVRLKNDQQESLAQTTALADGSFQLTYHTPLKTPTLLLESYYQYLTTNKHIILKYGDLQFIKTPNAIQFQPITLSGYTQIIKRKEPIMQIAVLDTRTQPDNWQIAVKLDTPLNTTTAKGDPLATALIFIDKQGNTHILNTEYQIVHQEYHPKQGQTDLYWQENEGLLLQLQGGQEVPEQVYFTNVSWALSNIP